jgi:hypothetical protein
MSLTHYPAPPRPAPEFRQYSRSRLAIVGVAGTAALLALAGCSSLEPDGAGAVSVSNAFIDAISSGDGVDACGLLNDAARESVMDQTGEECADGILDLNINLSGPADTSQVYSRAAFVDLGDSALFLTVGAHDWVIRAAGCAPDADRPFDCVIDGS